MVNTQNTHSMNSKKLTVAITGATSGVGRATALEFARKGYNLALTARRQDVLDTVAAECERIGGTAYTLSLDVSDEQKVYEFAKNAHEKFGSIDVWVNNAAVSILGPFEETPMENIKRLLDVNLMGYFYGSRAALGYFRDQGQGTLINVSSQVGLVGQPYSIAYTTSKSAIRGMSLSLQQELADEENIHVCMVLPATIDTTLFQNAANYMGRKVRAMEPIVDAWTVAKEIECLTRHPKQEVLVGGMAIQGTLLKFFAPHLFAKIYNKQVKEKHFSEEHSDPGPGNLFESSKHASVDGGWLDGKRSAGMIAQPSTPFWMSVVAGAVLTGALTTLLIRKLDVSP